MQRHILFEIIAVIRAMHIILFIYEKFASGESAPTHSDIKEYFLMPERLINEIITNLIELQYIYVIDTDENESRYTPARSAETLTVRDILHGLRRHGVSAEFEKNGDHIHSIVLELSQQYADVVDDAFALKSIKDVLQMSDLRNTPH